MRVDSFHESRCSSHHSGVRWRSRWVLTPRCRTWTSCPRASPPWRSRFTRTSTTVSHLSRRLRLCSGRCQLIQHLSHEKYQSSQSEPSVCSAKLSSEGGKSTSLLAPSQSSRTTSTTMTWSDGVPLISSPPSPSQGVSTCCSRLRHLRVLARMTATTVEGSKVVD
jgi:hypothetical protein